MAPLVHEGKWPDPSGALPWRACRRAAREFPVTDPFETERRSGLAVPYFDCGE